MDSRTEMAEYPASTTRRRLLKAVGAGVGVTALGTTTSTGQQSDYWTVVALPDTQVYAEYQTSYAKDQTQWIADNADAENIVFVSHEGDVVDHGDDDAEWQYMHEAMSTLDEAVPYIPYATVTGNHDYATLWDRQSSVAKYKEYFGPSRYDDRDWFGGAGPTNGDEGRDNLNTYQLFSAGGYDFLHLGLEWEPPGTVDDPSTPLGWAQSVLDQYPDRATILTTHSYLRDVPQRRTRRLQEANEVGNTGQTVWEELVSPNDQIFMVLCGHWHEDTGESGGEAHQVSTNADGASVYELLANYQFREDGGHGLLRRIEFRPGGGSDAPDRIQVRTYSPSTGEEKTDSDSQFGFDLDFDDRFGSAAAETPEPTETPEGPTATFQQGTDGYNGTTDTVIRAADSETSYGTAETLSISSSDPEGSGSSSQALLRFDGVIGTAAGQIPPGSDVEQATVALETSNEGDGAAIHRLRTDWSADSTWASLDDGVQTDDAEAVSDAITRTGPVETGETSIDVTASVQAWVNGAQNRGWVFRPLGSDSWDIQSADSATPPTLTVSYTLGETVAGDADGDGDVDTDDVNRIQRSVAGGDVDMDRDAADIDGDGDVDIGDAVSARNLAEGDQ